MLRRKTAAPQWLLLVPLAGLCLASARSPAWSAPAVPKAAQPVPKAAETQRYVAVGDSYSIGEGARPEEAWPSLLTKHLHDSGCDITLVANPSRTGWTTQRGIDNELPIYRASKPTFATLQIGVNDWVQGVDAKTFRERLALLMDAMLAELPDKRRLLVVTIPDFGKTPTGAGYANGRDIAAGIAEFNGVIAAEAALRHLTVVDVYPLSQQVAADPTLIAADGLHPSAREYALWEKLILPQAKSCVGAPGK